MSQSRREFIQQLGGIGAAFSITSLINNEAWAMDGNKKLFFDISLAQWSFHKSIKSGKMTTLDFPVRAKKEFGINAVEYVDQLFNGKASDKNYLKELLKISVDNGVKNHLIMVDTAGQLGDTNKKTGKKLLKNITSGLKLQSIWVVKLSG